MPVYTWSTPSMGGRLSVSISAIEDGRGRALAEAEHCGRRVNAWAKKLTRFSEASDLSRLNSTRARSVSVRPTLAAALDWAAVARERTRGVVDAALLNARLAAETGAAPRVSDDGYRAWRICWSGRSGTVERTSGTQFDLDGLAKGWLADRAADLLRSWPGVAVDADGDICLRADAGVEWLIDVADPRADATGAPLATLRVGGGDGWTRTYGVATSGTSVHRWQISTGKASHHLIDPRTKLPADTDVVQATVIAPSAREAEVIAKTAVILGSKDALTFLDHSAAHAALLLLESGRLACLRGIEQWLA